MTPVRRVLACCLVVVACGKAPNVGGEDGGTDAGCPPANLCVGGCFDVTSDPKHCGSCTNDCTTLPNVDPANVQCHGGACVLSGSGCAADHAHCASDPASGCETDLSQPTNCGACAVACAEPTPVCSKSNGVYACASGCSGQTPVRCGGMCIDTQSNAAHCGSCTNACAPPANATATCDGGSCGFACTTPFADCDQSAANGCEVNTGTDVAHCGGCATACSAANGTAACDGGACVVAACAAGFGDCDNNPANGCETNTNTDRTHCGGCATSCTANNVNGDCVAGVCMSTGCATGFADCDGNPANGCEVDTRNDPAHCGGCTSVCSLPNSMAGCSMGACTVGSCGDAGFADCDGVVMNGCEVNTKIDPLHCGGCANVCAVANGTSGCDGGTCSVAGCNTGFGDCDNNPANGCEANTATNPSSCGSCGNVCTLAHATAGCDGGACTVATCTLGYGNCDSDPANGCEVDLGSSPANCSGCGNSCTVTNGVPSCTAGVCGLASCNPGFGNCDNNAANGCEVSLTSDPSNCNSCGHVCSAPNATAGCAAGSCTVGTCNPGFKDCDGQPANGCEVNSGTDLSNCGACGNVCNVANGTAGCTGGACTVASCNAPYKDCDGQASNGCEANTLTNVNACGGCGRSCLLPNATPACSNGVCAIQACNPGWADCDGNPLNGCEVNIAADVGNCGTCGHTCTVANGAPACVMGACQVGACNAGFSDCDGLYPTGCETNVNTDPNHCGTCSKACSVANGTAGCANGTCAVAGCNAGFADCNGQPADGCEVNTNSDPIHCGSCSNFCNLPNATAACSNGTCRVAACNAPFADCDGNPFDGCEVNTTNNVNNCGGCGNNCSTQCVGNVAATTCAASKCTISGCSVGHFDVDGACVDGCECTSAGASQVCAAPSALASLVPGQLTVVTGNLVPFGTEAYYTVTFNGNTNAAYHPKVVLTGGAAGEFAFDILSNCSGALSGCGVEGGNSSGRTTWEVLYTAGDPSQPANFIPIPPVGNNGTVLIHVYRKSGPVTCDTFTLTVSD
jgi:hypothetical protein